MGYKVYRTKEFKQLTTEQKLSFSKVTTRHVTVRGRRIKEMVCYY